MYYYTTYVHMYISYYHVYEYEKPGADPTIASYNAGVVKIYSAASSLLRFGSKNIFLTMKKSIYVVYYVHTTLAL
jgi:hypothetical protein